MKDEDVLELTPFGEGVVVGGLSFFGNVLWRDAATIGIRTPARFGDDYFFMRVALGYAEIVLLGVGQRVLDGLLFPGGVGVDGDEVYFFREGSEFVVPGDVVFAEGDGLLGVAFYLSHVFDYAFDRYEVVCPVDRGFIAGGEVCDYLRVVVGEFDETADFGFIFQFVLGEFFFGVLASPGTIGVVDFGTDVSTEEDAQLEVFLLYDF